MVVINRVKPRIFILKIFKYKNTFLGIMAIEFEQLEKLLIEWNKRLSINKRIGDRTGEWVYSRMKEKINSIYIEKIKQLFENIIIEKAEVKENVDLQRAYGGFKSNKVVKIHSFL